METILKNPNECLSLSGSSNLMMTKIKPKIRIVHIFPSKIIQTDVANFRELVQKLTGKPVERRDTKKRKNKKQKIDFDDDNGASLSFEHVELVSLNHDRHQNFKQQQVKREFEEDEDFSQLWFQSNNGEFLSGFEEIDGFLQEFDGTMHDIYNN